MTTCLEWEKDSDPMQSALPPGVSVRIEFSGRTTVLCLENRIGFFFFFEIRKNPTLDVRTIVKY